MGENNLFYKGGHLSDFLEEKKLQIKKEIFEFDEEKFLGEKEEDLERFLREKYTSHPPVLKKDEKYLLNPKEVDIDVSRDQGRDIFDRSGPFYIKGTLITVVIPFNGDAALFNYRPPTYSLSIPQGIINRNELCLEYKLTEYNAKSLENKITHDIQQIESHLNWAKNAIDNFNTSLKDFINNLIEERKKKIIESREFINKLKIPIKKRE